MRPDDRSYLDSHEWAKLDGDLVTIGITDFAVEQLGELVYLDLPDVGRSLDAGEALGEVESVKAVSDINSPVAGEVVEANTDLPDDLEALQNDPMGAGWLIKVKPSAAEPFADLKDAAAYEEVVASES